MLREEAIEVLEKEFQIRIDPDFTMTVREWDAHDDNMMDALEMAIDALRRTK